jgi:sulfoxide reductase catalytic subunit YedY
MQRYRRAAGVAAVLLLILVTATRSMAENRHKAEERLKADVARLTPETPEEEIVRMKPSEVDPSLLPLDSIKDLNVTGIPPDIDIRSWRLHITGTRVRNETALSYGDLLEMGMVRRRVLLICPGFFADYAEWEGVPLEHLLKTVRARRRYDSITFVGSDGYSAELTRNELRGKYLFLALRVNGETLPEAHGFPVRLVAEGMLGGVWVKWVESMEIN